MSKSRRRSVRELADEAQVNVEDALVTLWDAGFEQIKGPSDQITGVRLKSARRALSIPTASDLRSLSYWQKRFDTSNEGLRKLLSEHSIEVSVVAKSLPKGTVKQVKQLAKDRYVPNVRVAPTPEPESTGSPVLDWHIIGKNERQLRFLTDKEVESVHWELVQDFREHNDPIVPAGIRFQALLSSAVFRAQTSLSGDLKYPTVEMAGAALMHSLIHNHPFQNGNKRTALVSLLVFLDENHVLLTCDEDSLFEMVLQVARHRIVDSDPDNLPDREVLAIAKWIDTNSRKIRQGERPLPFYKLKEILTGYGCKIGSYGRSGSKVNIERTIRKQRSVLPWRTGRVLHTQVYYGGDGKEVDRNTINKVRSDLELDEAHGVDSATFYEGSPWSTSDFILRYRKTLDGLSGL